MRAGSIGALPSRTNMASGVPASRATAWPGRTANAAAAEPRRCAGSPPGLPEGRGEAKTASGAFRLGQLARMHRRLPTASARAILCCP